MWLAIEALSSVPTTLTALLYSLINRSCSPYTKKKKKWNCKKLHCESGNSLGCIMGYKALVASNFDNISMMDKTFFPSGQHMAYQCLKIHL